MLEVVGADVKRPLVDARRHTPKQCGNGYREKPPRRGMSDEEARYKTDRMRSAPANSTTARVLVNRRL